MIKELFSNKKKIICIVGMGFVGTAMAAAISYKNKNKHNYNIICIDLPNRKGKNIINKINNGEFPFKTNDLNLNKSIRFGIKNKQIYGSTDISLLTLADIIICDVNFDIKKISNKLVVNNKNFISAIESISKYIRKEALLIIETTLPPGTSEKIVIPKILKNFKNKNINNKFLNYCYSFERVTPGKDYLKSIINSHRVFACNNNAASKLTRVFFNNLINLKKYKVIELNSIISCEMAKIMENSYRAVNIAFIDEWTKFSNKINVDLFEIINSIKMRKTHNNIMMPGIGVGGYCLTKDPYFIEYSSKNILGLKNLKFPFSNSSILINEKMPELSIRILDSLVKSDFKKKKVCIMGVSYKQDIEDTRNSPANKIYNFFKKKQCQISVFDPLVKKWSEFDIKVKNQIPNFQKFNIIIFITRHSVYRKIKFNINLKPNLIIFDSNNVLSSIQRKKLNSNDKIQFYALGRKN